MICLKRVSPLRLRNIEEPEMKDEELVPSIECVHKIGGWGECDQPGNRFGSHACTQMQSGSEVGIGKKKAGLPLFPFSVWA